MSAWHSKDSSYGDQLNWRSTLQLSDVSLLLPRQPMWNQRHTSGSTYHSSYKVFCILRHNVEQDLVMIRESGRKMCRCEVCVDNAQNHYDIRIPHSCVPEIMCSGPTVNTEIIFFWSWEELWIYSICFYMGFKSTIYLLASLRNMANHYFTDSSV